jgi:hypothetical protein
MSGPTIIPFYPNFGRPDVNKDALLAQFTAWLDEHGKYGRLYMWLIDHPENDFSRSKEICGVKIYDPEVGTLFKLLHEI